MAEDKPTGPLQTKDSGKDYQKEQMANQPVNRAKTMKTNSSTDASDIGSGKKGTGANILEDNEMPRHEVANPEQYMGQANKGKRLSK